jgi:hypothetical protein
MCEFAEAFADGQHRMSDREHVQIEVQSLGKGEADRDWLFGLSGAPRRDRLAVSFKILEV